MKKTLFVIIQVLSLSSTVFAENRVLAKDLQDMNCDEIHQVMIVQKSEATQLAKDSLLLTKLNSKDQIGAAMQQLAIEKLVQADQIENLFNKKCFER